MTGAFILEGAIDPAALSSHLIRILFIDMRSKAERKHCLRKNTLPCGFSIDIVNFTKKERSLAMRKKVVRFMLIIGCSLSPGLALAEPESSAR
ncbi:MAG: hypothetical protein C4293_07270 [Nitrospiraceae bacterium]